MTSFDIIAIGSRVTARLADERRRIVDAIRELQLAQQRPAPAPSWPVADPTPRLAAQPGYELLAQVLDDALDQAQSGKGRERHARPGQPFESQPIVRGNEELGTTHGAIAQVRKKALESLRLPVDRAVAELLGVIVYAAAAIIVLRRMGGRR